MDLKNKSNNLFSTNNSDKKLVNLPIISSSKDHKHLVNDKFQNKKISNESENLFKNTFSKIMSNALGLFTPVLPPSN